MRSWCGGLVCWCDLVTIWFTLAPSRMITWIYVMVASGKNDDGADVVLVDPFGSGQHVFA